ncbi:MAG: MFS transporter [Candidatus Freyarchaeota archaeon]|nr:MFS transporter [Candidatus Jordarchaeia archaeon]MBS7268801.1 MFS transporter [Candidatus Jordarchaeia archaeon]MBS7279162.1 MFS transporter [Candidatus Jordarchaeia archaeon]
MGLEGKDDKYILKEAAKFVILLGVVSLFADMTYEGARSITGPYLSILGASGTIVGIVAGLGELVGYGLRLISGYISDRTGKYWAVTISGYVMNLFAVPLLALAGRLDVAIILIILERVGKGIRTPARDAMLSHATAQMGHGWGFGVHEALDQIGAILGPLTVAAILYFEGSYQVSFAVLLVPALLALSVLVRSRFLYPRPRVFEEDRSKLQSREFPKVFWLYLVAVALIAAGFADFSLVAFHFKEVAVVSDDWIPLFYAVAMGVDALAALLFGRLFDRVGMPTLIVATVISLFCAPLVFLGNFYFALLGVALWGVGMGAQESIMRATIAGMVSIDRRGSAYGIFNTGYGVFWFLGSALMGMLYDVSIPALITFSVAAQLASIPILLLVGKKFLHTPR